MTFLNPLDALIPTITFSFFADFWVWVTSKARRSVSVGFWGSRQLSLFGGGVWLEGSIDPPPPLGSESPPAHVQVVRAWCLDDAISGSGEDKTCRTKI